MTSNEGFILRSTKSGFFWGGRLRGWSGNIFDAVSMGKTIKAAQKNFQEEKSVYSNFLTGPDVHIVLTDGKGKWKRMGEDFHE